MTMRTRTRVLGGLAAVALTALLAWAFAPRPVDVEVAPATLGPFERTVSEDGKTRLRERYTVAAPLSGRLARIRLVEGDRVEAGAVVATLTPVLSPLLDERSRAELAARIASAQANLARSGVRVEQAQLAVAQTRNDLQRSEQLARQGFVSPTRLDTERLAMQSAQREAEAAEQERQIARHDLAQARAALAATRGEPEGPPTTPSTSQGAGQAVGQPFALRAPVAGQVLRVLQTSETPVALGTPLLELGDLAQLEVMAELLTADALATPPDSEVRIDRWGGPAALKGRVRRVEPAAFTKVSALGVEEQRVRVLIDITSPRTQWQALGDGFRVGVHIVTLAVPQAVSVPVSAVFPLPAGEVVDTGASPPASEMSVGQGAAGAAADPGDGAERRAVFVVEGGRARLRPVWVAARDGSRVWVRRGLAAGDQVVIYPAANLTDGVRVRPRRV